MYIRYRTLQALSRVIQRVHSVPPWHDPAGFFGALHEVIPFDYSVGFIKIDPATSRILPFAHTLSNGGGDDAGSVAAHNSHFWRVKRPIVQRILRSKSHAFHLSSSLGELAKPQRQEYQAEFWRKFGVRHSIARYFRCQHGWLLAHLNRAAGTDFTEEEQTLLGLLVPHLELVVAQAGTDAPMLFANRHGNIVSADAAARVALHDAPDFADALCAALPRWIARLASRPLVPLCDVLDVAGDRYRVTVSQSGPGPAPLYRVAWRDDLPSVPDTAGILSRFAHAHRLSAREREILALLAAGHQTKEIARQLGLAVPTVKEYVGLIYRKCGARGRGKLAAMLLSARLSAPMR